MEKKNKYDRAIEAADEFISAMKAIQMFGDDLDESVERFKEEVRHVEYLDAKLKRDPDACLEAGFHG